LTHCFVWPVHDRRKCISKPKFPAATESTELLAHLRELGWDINFCWIPREHNEECDALSKEKLASDGQAALSKMERACPATWHAMSG